MCIYIYIYIYIYTHTHKVVSLLPRRNKRMPSANLQSCPVKHLKSLRAAKFTILNDFKAVSYQSGCVVPLKFLKSLRATQVLYKTTMSPDF